MSVRSQRKKLPRPLEGIKVVDCTRVLSGPICSRMLSDMGADVVKIEAPESDILRATPPIVDGFGTMFAQYNVGKRNVSIDLKQDGGAALLDELIEGADVLVENFRPGVLERLGLAPGRLLARDPALVICSISGWGQDGAWSSKPAYAPMVQAEAGILAMSGRLRNERLRGDTMQHADLYAGMMATQGILAALFHRARTGAGQHVDVAMAEALLYINEHATAEVAGFDGSSGFPTWTFESFTLADGRSIHLMGSPEQLFPLLAARLPITGALEDARFATAETRSQNRDALVEVLDDALSRVANQAALTKLLEGSPAIVVPIRTTQELAESEWAQERGAFTDAGPNTKIPTAAWRATGLEIGIDQARLAHRGEDNADVLRDWLGKTPSECQALEASGILQVTSSEPRSLDSAPRKAFRAED